MDDFEKAAEHINYEFGMLTYTAKELNKRPSDNNFCDAMLESFLVHARALIEFFFPRPSSRPTDINAEKYLSIWADIRGKNPLEKELKKMDQWLAHMVQARYKKRKPQWEISHIYEKLKFIMKLFQENLEQKDKEQIIIEEIYLPDELTYASGITVSQGTSVMGISKNRKS